MWERFKVWWYSTDEDEVEEEPEITPYDGYDLTVDLMRKLLGSITGRELPKRKEEMVAAERKAYVQMVAAFFPQIIEGRMKRLIRAQEELMATGSSELRELMPEAKDQIIFGRGTINGLALVFEDFNEDFQEYIGSLPKDEPFDKYKLFPEIFKKERSGEEE